MQRCKALLLWLHTFAEEMVKKQTGYIQRRTQMYLDQKKNEEDILEKINEIRDLMYEAAKPAGYKVTIRLVDSFNK